MREFKFAVDIREGDTKPVEKEEESSNASGSDDSSDSKSENDHYGVINEDHSKAASHKNKSGDSAYAVYINDTHNEKKH